MQLYLVYVCIFRDGHNINPVWFETVVVLGFVGMRRRLKKVLLKRDFLLILKFCIVVTDMFFKSFNKKFKKSLCSDGIGPISKSNIS